MSIDIDSLSSHLSSASSDAENISVASLPLESAKHPHTEPSESDYAPGSNAPPVGGRKNGNQRVPVSANGRMPTPTTPTTDPFSSLDTTAFQQSQFSRMSSKAETAVVPVASHVLLCGHHHVCLSY